MAVLAFQTPIGSVTYTYDYQEPLSYIGLQALDGFRQGSFYPVQAVTSWFRSEHYGSARYTYDYQEPLAYIGLQLVGGGSGTVETPVTYYLRGYAPELNQHVYWSSTGTPDLSPSVTVPVSVVANLVDKCVLGIGNN